MAPKTPVPAKKPIKEYTVDCMSPANDGIMNTVDFKRFLEQNFKISGKRHNLENVKISLDESTHIIKLESTVPVSKKYVKYLTKKYLCKNYMRDWIRVMAPNNKSNAYVLKYFKIINNDDRSDDDMSD